MDFDHVLLDQIRTKILEDKVLLDTADIKNLVTLPDSKVPSLAALAHEVRLQWCGPEVELEGIISAKTGACPEDCSFCSQSSYYEGQVQALPMLDPTQLLAAAKETEKLGATEFCLVLAIKGINDHWMAKILEAVKFLRENTSLNIALSAGLLDQAQADILFKAGVHRYNHNLETSYSYFDKIVTTHSWEQRYQTCEYVKKSGMELCSGVLLGLGESQEQRIELLKSLQELHPQEVPVNFLNPRPETPLGGTDLVEPLEAIRWIAIFRLALPWATLRYAGGREVTLKELQAMGMTAGINALIVGNYLTTLGREPQQDIQMLKDLKMPIAVMGKII